MSDIVSTGGDKIYSDARWTLEWALDSDQTDAQHLRFYIVGLDGTVAGQWGDDYTPGDDGSAGEGDTVTATDRAQTLGITEGYYVVQYKRVDATGTEETVQEKYILFYKPTDE